MLRDLYVREGLMTREQAERRITPELAAERLGPDGMQVAVYATRQRKAGLEGEEADLPGTSATAPPRPDSPPRGSCGDLSNPARRGLRPQRQQTGHASGADRDAEHLHRPRAPRGRRPARALGYDERAGRPGDVGHPRQRNLTLRLYHPDRTGDIRYTTPEIRRAEERLVGTVRAEAQSGMGILRWAGRRAGSRGAA
jgi:hypothetical protein